MLSFFHFKAHSQKDTTLSLIQSEVKFPYQSNKFEMVVSTSIYMKDTSKIAYVLPDISGEKHVYKFGMAWLLPYTREIQAAIMNQSFIKEQSFCLIKTSSRDSVFIVIDENANKDFSDEVIDVVKIGQPAYKKLNLVLDSFTNLRFLVPIQIEVNRTPADKLQISCKNLAKYELIHHLEDTTLRLNLLMNPFNVNFKIQDIDLKDGKIRIQSIEMKEPFFFNGKLRVLDQFDLLKATVKFRTLAPDEIPLGYREGYYLDIKKLRSLTDPYLASDCGISWSKSKYFLLYFWGHWCAPCMSKIEATKSLAERLNASDQIILINYPTVFHEKDTLALSKVIFSNKLPCRQVVQVIGPREANEGIAIRDVVSLAKINAYPEYLLLNSKGKILYKGENKEQELDALLKELKIISN